MSIDLKGLKEFSKTIKVLLVEDNPDSRGQAVKLLSNFFDNITEAKDGQNGLDIFKSGDFDLIISDINMPVMNGIEMISNIRSFDEDVPIIILSAHDDSNYFLDTIKLNISGYVLKPIDIEQLLGSINRTLEKLKLKHELQKHKEQLEEINTNLELQVAQRMTEIIELNKEITETQKEVVFTMGAIGESRSKETGQHVKRVAEYSKLLAIYSGMSEEDAEMLKQASPMHDIGKVGIPDDILNAPRKLTKEEFEVIKTHSQLGYDMLKSSKKALLKLASTIAYEHHEKWDGSGYPRGLVEEDIALSGRITAIADVFDALGSERKYKKAWDDEKIFSLLKEEKGKHFDPSLVDIFFKHLDEFLAIRDSLKE